MEKYGFKPLEKDTDKISSSNNEKLLDNIPIPYTAQLGNGKALVRELKGLTKGSILPLNVETGDYFKLMIGHGHNKNIALGIIIEDESGDLFFKIEEVIDNK